MTRYSLRRARPQGRYIGGGEREAHTDERRSNNCAVKFGGVGADTAATNEEAREGERARGVGLSYIVAKRLILVCRLHG